MKQICTNEQEFFFYILVKLMELSLSLLGQHYILFIFLLCIYASLCIVNFFLWLIILVADCTCQFLN